MLEVISEFWSEYGGILLTGTRDTLVMVLISTLFAYLLGLPLGVALTVTQPHGIRPSKTVNQILGWIVNIGRSVPFIILMVAIMPFTKLVVGTKTPCSGSARSWSAPSCPWWSPPPPLSPAWWKPLWQR